MQGTSKTTPLSNFNLSAHHRSSLEQKQLEIAASREAQLPVAGGGDSVKSDGDFCSGWCSPFHCQAVHPRIWGDDTAALEDRRGGPRFPSKSHPQAQTPGARPCSSPGSLPPGSIWRKMSKKYQCWQGRRDIETCIHCWWAREMEQLLWKSLAVAQKVNAGLTCDPGIWTLGMYPRGINTNIHKKSYT